MALSRPRAGFDSRDGRIEGVEMTEKKDSSNVPDFDNKKLSDMAIEMMESEAIQRVKRELPNLPKHVQEIQKSRGAGIESAIMCEQVITPLLQYMGYNKEKIIDLTFGQKITEMINILNKNLKEDQWLKETVDCLRKIKRLRNIYAHVPGDYKSGELRFDPAEEYYNEDEQEFRFKSLKELNDIFADLDDDIRKRLSEIMKRIVPIREKEKLKVKKN